ncbi:MAG TPA: energy transducer TonB [Allosphingosinicella sp.]|nr:energy transducer TonB [Allosphingosinicella sp.]
MNAYFSVDDYPASALRARAEGTTEVLLTVNPDGRVSGCVVSESSGSAALDMATCRILRSRARYFPARPPVRIPAFEPDRVRIIWRLPPR